MQAEDIVTLSQLDLTLRVLAAIALGGAIGLEREVNYQHAGLRTHIVLCLGAALYGIISAHGFSSFFSTGLDEVQMDPGRTAAQVATGVGFLGAGVIVKQGASVRGLTTAASLWVTAAIGLAVGIGYVIAAAVTTIATVLSLVVLRWLRPWIRHFRRSKERTITVAVARRSQLRTILNVIYSKAGDHIEELRVSQDDDQGATRIDVALEEAYRGVDSLITALSARDDIDLIAT